MYDVCCWFQIHNVLYLFIFKIRNKENVLFKDVLNTFYLQLYCIGHNVKDHSYTVMQPGKIIVGEKLRFELTEFAQSSSYRWSISRSSQYSTTGETKAMVCGMCYPVCGMVHIKEPLLLIDKSSLCGGSRFPFSLSEWSLTICLMPYNRR